MDELKDLQREAAKLPTRGKRATPTTEDVKPEPEPETEETTQAVRDLAAQIERALPLLAAFGLGVAVGRLFSRK